MIKAESIIFDLDGTLWSASEASYLGWIETAKKDPEYKKYMYEPSEFVKSFGMTIDDLADTFLPGLDDKRKAKFIKDWEDHANGIIKQKKGTKLFDGVKETLEELKKEHHLYIVSNCERDYLTAFFAAHELDYLFDDFECWGRTLLEKSASINILLRRNHITSACYVGDTYLDQEAAYKSGLKFIHAGYGFGNVDKYDEKLERFSDLKNVIL